MCERVELCYIVALDLLADLHTRTGIAPYNTNSLRVYLYMHARPYQPTFMSLTGRKRMPGPLSRIMDLVMP